MNSSQTDQIPLQKSLDTALVAIRGQRTVLIVDDEAESIEMLQFILGKFECIIDVARDAESALEVIRANPIGFRVAFIDQRLPKMPGLELLSKISREFPCIFCVMTTGYVDREFYDQCKEFGVVLIEKPATFEQVKSILASLGIIEKTTSS